MTKLVALDDGHGKNTAGKRTPYIKSLGREIRENEFNEPVVNYLKAELQRCGFKTVLTAPTDADTPLAQRVSIANNAKADLFISIHFNAFDGTFEGKNPEGFSAHIDPSRGQSEVFAKIALKHLAAGTKQVNRGLVLQQLYVTANTKLPAVLFELGFMDNEREALLMLNKNFQKECAKEIAMAVCEYYKVKYVPEAATVKPPTSLVKIGTATMLQDVHAYAEPKFGTQTGDVIKKGKALHIYAIKNGWYQLFNGEYIPSGYGKNFNYEPVKKPEPPKPAAPKPVAPKPTAKPEAAKVDVYRVKVDGEQVGAYGNPKNALEEAEKAIKDGKKKVELERV
jgi:N-acetylmuramoyl-L-alanine amidase